jgi:hypothetical protein
MRRLVALLLLVLPLYALAQLGGGGPLTGGLAASAGGFPITGTTSVLAQDIANIINLRNGTNAQELRVYSTYSGNNSNDEFLQIQASAGSAFQLLANKGGSGTIRSVCIGPLNGQWCIATTGEFVGSSAGSYMRLNYAPQTYTGTTYTIDRATYVIANGGAASTITFPSCPAMTGRAITITNTTAFAVASAASNVVPLAGGSAGTAILAAGPGKFAHVVCDGTNWITVMAN